MIKATDSNQLPFTFRRCFTINEFDRLSRMTNRIKAEYPEGTRILLIQMGDDDPRPIPPNTRGTVDFVDDMRTVHCTFDNGRRLGLAYGADSYRKLTEQELAEENNAICVEESTDELIEESEPTMSM